MKDITINLIGVDGTPILDKGERKVPSDFNSTNNVIDENDDGNMSMSDIEQVIEEKAKSLFEMQDRIFRAKF
jgi:hypothetical protein